MPDPTLHASAPRRRRAASAIVLVGLALMPASALAWPEDARSLPPRSRHRRAAPPVQPPAMPREAIVSGYLPRNNNVPMYNEPPRLRASGGPAW